MISKDFNVIDKILETAQKENLLQLTEKTFLMTPEVSSLQFEKPKIVKQEESAKCKFCGKKLSTGYYVVFKSHTYGLTDHPAFGKCILIIYCEEKATAIEIFSLYDLKCFIF